MTLGARIQEQRKGKGLSQEALGEALGVSRQAISKWEADAAIPEVDKLIALSRLFGVSVGALLGVEEETAPGDAPLSDRELQAVEAIVGRYAEELGRHAPPPRRRRWIWPVVAAALAVALLAGWGALSGRIDALDRQYGALQRSLSSLESNVQGQAGSVAAQVEDILNRQNNLIAAWRYSVPEIAPEAGTGTLLVSLTPRQYTQGMAAVVSAVLADGTRFSAEAVPVEGPAPAFSAALTLPLTGAAASAAALSVTLTTGETRETQLLDTLYDLRYNVGLSMDATYSGTVSPTAASLRWEGQVTVNLSAGALPACYTGSLQRQIFPTAAELRWYLDGEAAHAMPLALDPWEANTSSMSVDTSLSYTLPTFRAEQVDFVLRVTDSLGQVGEFLIDRWVPGGDGILEPAPSAAFTMLPAPIQP